METKDIKISYKKSDSKERKLVQIKWNDSKVIHGWRVTDCKDDEIAHCITVGILKNETKELITVAFGDSDEGSVLETITIPRGCITEIRKLMVG